MNEVKTTEDFEKARQEFDKANPPSNPSPVPWYVSQGRYFMGLGKQPSSIKEAA